MLLLFLEIHQMFLLLLSFPHTFYLLLLLQLFHKNL